MNVTFIPAKRFRPVRKLSLQPYALAVAAVGALILTTAVGLPVIGVALVLWLAVRLEKPLQSAAARS